MTGAFFQPDSEELVLGSSVGMEVSSAPIVGGLPDFANPVFQTPIFSGNVNGCVYDRINKRIFTTTRGGTAGSAQILDGDVLSPTYGSIVESAQLPFGGDFFDLSEDSTLMAMAGLAFNGTLAFVDVDPDSTGFLSVTQSNAVPVTGAIFAGHSFISPDNRFASVLLIGIGSGASVGKYDRQTQTWIDAIPALPGIQHFPLPISTPRSIVPIRGTESAFMNASNGSLYLLEMPGDDPANWTASILQDFPGTIEGMGISPDRTRIALTLSDPPRLIIADSTSGAMLSETSLPVNARNTRAIAWTGESFNPVSYCAPTTVNSTGVSAILTASGSEEVAVNNLAMTVNSAPPLGFGFLITSQQQGLVVNPGGSQGTLCLSGAIGRYVGPGQIQQASTNGDWTLPIDITQQPQPTGSVSVAIGESWNYQAWYRDSVNGLPTSNFTNGLTVNFR